MDWPGWIMKLTKKAKQRLKKGADDRPFNWNGEEIWLHLWTHEEWWHWEKKFRRGRTTLLMRTIIKMLEDKDDDIINNVLPLITKLENNLDETLEESNREMIRYALQNTIYTPEDAIKLPNPIYNNLLNTVRPWFEDTAEDPFALIHERYIEYLGAKGEETMPASLVLKRYLEFANSVLDGTLKKKP